MNYKIGRTLALALLALAAAQTRAQNLVTNGSFETPAHPGNGDIYGTDPGFSLPGWSVSGSSSNVFVEYGIHVIDQLPPLVQTRYADGRQALCLNDYGLGGAHINQLVPVTTGQNYVLSFAQADASMAAATVSQITVNLRLGLNADPLERTFSRTNDGPGYTVKTWHFTAGPIRPSVDLNFTDTTTNGLPEISPFLDSISVVPGSLVAVSSNTVVPGGGANHFGQLPAGLGVNGSNRVFFGAATGGLQGIYGLIPSDPMHPGDPIKIADLNTPIPGGSGNFTSFTGSGGPPDPCISGDNVVFWGMGANNQQGIYAWPADPIYPSDPIKIADHNTAVPPGNLGNFGGFSPNSETPPDPCISGRRVAFYAYTDSGGGIYSATLDGALTTIADTSTPTPGSTDNDHFVAFYVFHVDPSISGNNVAFSAYSGNGSNSITVGVYLSTDGVLPADPYIPGDPMKVLDLNDTLDGKTITGLRLSRTGLDRDNNLLAFGATFSDGTEGLYTLNVFTGLRITSMAKAGPDLQVSFASQVGHNYNVQSRADLLTGGWSNLLTQIPGNGLVAQTTVSNAFVAPRQFYRIQQEP